MSAGNVGNYKNAGCEWHRKGESPRVNGHDFPSPDVPRAHPYGVYDLARNRGFVNVGTDHDTGTFAVASIRKWWLTQGRRAYPKAKRCRQVDALVERFRLHDEPLIVAGDFNCSWDDGEDALRLIAEGLSLRCSGDCGGFTFPSHSPENRLDWIFISDDLEFVDTRIWPDLCSDHLGAVATLAWK